MYINSEKINHSFDHNHPTMFVIIAEIYNMLNSDPVNLWILRTDDKDKIWWMNK